VNIGLTRDYAGNPIINLPDIGAFEYFSAAEKPGDFDNNGRVDIFDYNLVVGSFNHPYTIFDYNAVVGNFGH
jgi:hypothetical protein